MKIAALALAIAAVLVPMAAVAQDACDHRRLKSAPISCAEVHVWDAKAVRCVPVSS